MDYTILTGQCASPGEAEGTIRYYHADVPYTKEDIVVLNEWVTKDIARLREVGGLLSAQGGITCHASIIAREFNLPCLVGVHGLDAILEGTRVAIDAAAEEIRVIRPPA